MMAHKPPRTSMMKPAVNSPHDTLQPTYEDPDASVPAVPAGSQSEVKIRPVPCPRSKIQPKAPSNTSYNAADSVDKTSSAASAVSSQLSEYPVEYKRPRPVCPPPRPPVGTAAVDRGSHYRSADNERAVGPPAVSTVGAQIPPPRPPRPSIYYDRSPSPRLNYEATGGPDVPAVPRSPQRSTTAYETSLPQIRPPPPQFRPPPPPPAGRPSESLYSEVEYLDVLPGQDDETTQRRSTVDSRQHSASRQQAAEDTEEVNMMLRWLKRVSKSDFLAPSVYGLSVEEEMRSFSERATNVRKALRLYNFLMMKRNKTLRDAIAEFGSISCSLDKMQKKTKTMGIAGGTTGAVGGVTAVLGIALAPMTMGISLVATAVGAGMVASAGGIGAHAAKTNKKTVTRATVEKLVCHYKANIVDLEHCLDFILAGMNELRRHAVARLQRAGAQSDALRLAYLSQSVLMDSTSGERRLSGACSGGLSSERLLQAFAKEMDQYFTENEGQNLKKSNKSKFSGRVRLLAENLQDELDDLNRMWEMFT